MDLNQRRNAIRHLLNDDPASAAAAYYAFYHPDAKTSVQPYPAEAERAMGFVTFSRTGMDLFRSLVTMRLPIDDLETSAEIIYHAMQPETAVILHIPTAYLPLIQALFDVQTIEQFSLYTLDRSTLDPIINVLVTQSTGPNGLPRFVVRSQQDNRVIAAAGINWQSPGYASLSVNTDAARRRQGLGTSVLSAIAQYVVDNGRTPLYEVAADANPASQILAAHIGFRYTLEDKAIVQAILKSRFV